MENALTKPRCVIGLMQLAVVFFCICTGAVAANLYEKLCGYSSGPRLAVFFRDRGVFLVLIPIAWIIITGHLSTCATEERQAGSASLLSGIAIFVVLCLVALRLLGLIYGLFGCPM